MSNKIGEVRFNNFGSKMEIIEYRGCNDIDVYFEEYDWTAKGVKYNNFKKGAIKCPYEATVYGVGYLGEGKYQVCINSKITRCYKTWQHMLERCYDEKYQLRKPTYKGCTVCEEWHNFQNFAEWYYNNYYEEVESISTKIDDKKINSIIKQ